MCSWDGLGPIVDVLVYVIEKKSQVAAPISLHIRHAAPLIAASVVPACSDDPLPQWPRAPGVGAAHAARPDGGGGGENGAAAMDVDASVAGRGQQAQQAEDVKVWLAVLLALTVLARLGPGGWIVGSDV